MQGNRAESERSGKRREQILAKGYYPVGESHLLRGWNTNDEQIKVYREILSDQQIRIGNAGIYILTC